MSEAVEIMKDLKPCPFCGGKDFGPVWIENGEYCVECRRCGALGPDPDYQEDKSNLITWDSRSDG